MQITHNLKTIGLPTIIVASLTIGLLSLTNAYAAPSSNVVWTAETRNLIKHANIDNGQKIHEDKCAKCHGDNGASMDVLEDGETPFIAAQIPHATYKQIVDYIDKKRDDSTMLKKVKNLSPQDIADVSAFYATQQKPIASVTADKVTPESIKLAQRGDGARFIPPCAGCHGLNGEGSIVDVPALAGQSAGYFNTTMMMYKEGDRTNDIYSRMRFIAEQLTEDEITGLADYYASIGTKATAEQIKEIAELAEDDEDDEDEDSDEKEE